VASSSHDRPAGMFARFFHWEVSGSLVLLACAIAALVWANSGWADQYYTILHFKLNLLDLDLDLHHWVNDGLMAIFFFVVGLEIKREIVVGELSSFRRAAGPIAAALGGMMVPALVYVACTYGGEGVGGWGIPMATDIAFALGILALFGKRVPITLKVFLTALAIVDDLGAVTVIALFYTESIHMPALYAAGGLLLVMFGAGRLGIRGTWIYLTLAIMVWLAFMASNVHTTVAGTIIAMLVPVRSRNEPSEFLESCRQKLEELAKQEPTKESMISEYEQRKVVNEIYLGAEDVIPPGPQLEHALHPITTFVILPLFALFNAGVAINAESLSAGPFDVGLGIVLGLVAGKQIGIMLFAWLAIKSKLADLPEGTTLGQLWGASCLAGVGFTMSLFISALAFKSSPELDTQAKLSVLLASLIAGVIGMIVLSKTLPKAAAED